MQQNINYDIILLYHNLKKKQEKSFKNKKSYKWTREQVLLIS